MNKKDTSRKDELTLRYKLDWDIDNTTKIKFLVSQIDINDPADIWTIDKENSNSKDVVFMSQPQFWYLLSEKISIGGEMRITNNFYPVNGWKYTKTKDLTVIR